MLQDKILNKLPKLKRLIQEWEGKYQTLQSIGYNEEYTEKMDEIENVLKGVRLAVEAVAGEEKVLRVIRTTYGDSRHPVLMLDYGDGGARPIFPIDKEGNVTIGIIHHISLATSQGYEVKYETEEVN